MQEGGQGGSEPELGYRCPRFCHLSGSRRDVGTGPPSRASPRWEGWTPSRKMLKSRQIKGGPHGVRKAVPRTVRRHHAKVGGTLPGVNGVNGSTHSAGCGGKGGTLSARRMTMLWPLPVAQRICQRLCAWRGPPGRRISHNGDMSASTTCQGISAFV